MDRLGIITYHKADNYGTCLQAFALQKILTDIGFDTEIINYSHKTNLFSDNKIKKIRNLVRENGVFGTFYFFRTRKIMPKKKNKFKNFRENYFKYSSKTYTTFEELKAANNIYNYFVCGSDMIWAIDLGHNSDIYFLRFCDISKRIAYAPSFGSISIKKENENRLKEYLKEMNFLSCREESGVKLIKEISGRNAQLVLDPTLLIDRNEWVNLFSSIDNIMDPKNNYILCYMFEGIPDRFKNKIKEIAKILKLNVRYIPMKNIEFIKEKKYSSSIYGPKEFVQMFNNASFIVTNSYHGTAFSVIFNKPFIVLQRKSESTWSKYEDRMYSFLNILKLTDRYVTDETKITEDIMDINYLQANSIINEMRKVSLDYLKNALLEVSKAKKDKYL